MTLSEWINTPGGYYAIAYLLSSIVIIWNSPRKTTGKKTVAIIGGLGITLFVLMTATHGLSKQYFIPFILCFFVIIWMMIYAVCKYDMITAVYFTARAFIAGEFVASLEWQVFYYIIKFKILPFKYTSDIIVLILVDGFLIFILNLMEKRNKSVNDGIQINIQELISAGSITLAIFTVSNVSYLLEETAAGELVISQVFIIRTLVDLGGVAILYAYHVQLGQLNMRYEVERLQDMLEMQHNNYEMLRQSVSVVDQKYHDLKYQIAVLKTETDSKGREAYLNQMEQEIKAYEAQNKTGNKTLDTILTGKTLVCQNNWIELTSVVDGEELDFMEPMDISTLFGNMLDNAIESVIKIEQKEKRLIHLAVTQQKGFLRIRMENCYEIEPKFKNGIPITSKADRKYHGFGIKSIQNTVKKYGGSTNMKAENGWFEVRILIPLPRE